MGRRSWSEMPTYLASYFEGMVASADDDEAAVDKWDRIMKDNYRAALDAVVESRDVGHLDWFCCSWIAESIVWEYHDVIADKLLVELETAASDNDFTDAPNIGKLYDFTETFICEFIANPATQSDLYARLEVIEKHFGYIE